MVSIFFDLIHDKIDRLDCLAMDCDNDHSENPRDWVTPEMIREMLPDVPLGIHYSRHHDQHIFQFP